MYSEDIISNVSETNDPTGEYFTIYWKQQKNKKSIMNKKEALECIRNVEADRVPKEFYKDKSFVLEAVKITGLTLFRVDESFKKDKSIVLTAVKQDGGALEYADKSLKNDPDVIKAGNR